MPGYVTSLAQRKALQAGITLIGFARESALIFIPIRKLSLQVTAGDTCMNEQVKIKLLKVDGSEHDLWTLAGKNYGTVWPTRVWI